MKKYSNFIFVVIALCFSLLGNAQGKYILKSGDANGINKWYMGRQIAQVMSHYGIDWLEREERDKEENTSLLLKNLNVQPGMMIADIGAGSGYHSSLLSKMVGNGKVYAVDVELEMIAFLQDRIKAEKTKNVVPILCTEQTIGLPANSIDLMLLVDVYHEFSYPYEMGVAMLEALKPGGKLVLVEPEYKLAPASKMIGLDGQKMSKSYNNTIALREPPESVEKKIKTMPTDPARIRRNDPGNPNHCPVWQLHQVYSSDEVKAWVETGCKEAKIGCIECKQPVIDAVNKELKPIQERAFHYIEDPDLVKNIVAEGCEKARKLARETMREVREAMGLSY